ncbi:MAG: hypothetical protein ACKVQU_33025 [Burkholderiales bacterium]
MNEIRATGQRCKDSRYDRLLGRSKAKVQWADDAAPSITTRIKAAAGRLASAQGIRLLLARHGGDTCDTLT